MPNLPFACGVPRIVRCVLTPLGLLSLAHLPSQPAVHTESGQLPGRRPGQTRVLGPAANSVRFAPDSISLSCTNSHTTRSAAPALTCYCAHADGLQLIVCALFAVFACLLACRIVLVAPLNFLASFIPRPCPFPTPRSATICLSSQRSRVLTQSLQSSSHCHA